MIDIECDSYLAPGECDEALLAFRGFLTHWLDNTPSHLPSHQIRLPNELGRWSLSPLLANVVQRRRVFAWAPYVGDPFIYMWDIGVDSYGNQIAASDSCIEYLPEDFCVPKIGHHVMPHRRCILR